ncbi:MAG: copper-binding protein [Calothrix sp. CSU_2_0]|nr:copper-binding protein [Calothrix sp. CSU_2_0]
MTAHEMAFRMSQSSVSPGKVDFLVTNTSEIPHEMAVIKTDLPVSKLPVINNGQLDKQKAGTLVGEINVSELKTGATKLLSLDLTPGNYLIISNLPGQFQAGMITQFTVK